MRTAEAILSIIIAIAVVYVVNRGSSGISVKQSSTSNNYTVEVTPIPTALADSTIIIPITITGPKDSTLKYVIRYAKPNLQNAEQLHRYGTTPLTLVDSTAGLYHAKIQMGLKGKKSYYYFEIRDPIGRYLAGVKMPDAKPFVTVAVGRADNWTKLGYYLAMFLAILAISNGAIGSISLIAGRTKLAAVRLSFMLGTAFLAVSAILLGSYHRLQLTGDTWQAVPFGENFSDNLMQILLIYLVFIILVSKLVKAKSGEKRSILPAAGVGYIGIVSFFLMMTAYLLPLLIQPTIPHTAKICYAIISLLLVAYLLLLRKAKYA